MRAFRTAISGDIRWYWGNAVFTAFSDSLVSFALILLILEVTGSLSLMALMAIVNAVPNILFGLFSAVWVDRWNPVRVIQLSQLSRAGIVCCFVAADQLDLLWLTFVIAFAQSTVGTFDDPARGRLARSLTTDESRLSMNSFTQTGRTIASVAGTTMAGVLVATANDNYWPVFLVAALGYTIAGQVVKRIETVEKDFNAAIEAWSVGTHLAEARKGFSIVLTSPTLTAVMVVVSAATLGASAATVLLTPFIVDVLEISPAWFGVVEGSQAIGAIVASFGIGVVGSRIKPKHLAVIALLGTGVAIAAIGSSTSLVILLVCMVLVGVSITPVSSSISTIFQSTTDKSAIGRIAAMLNMIAEPFSILGMAGAGILADNIGVPQALWVSGAICCLAGLLAWIMFSRETESVKELAE